MVMIFPVLQGFGMPQYTVNLEFQFIPNINHYVTWMCYFKLTWKGQKNIVQMSNVQNPYYDIPLNPVRLIGILIIMAY